MASKSYYNQQPPLSNDNDHDQQHLLSPSMSSPGYSSGHPSPMKPLHLQSQNPAYHHGPDYQDFEHLKEVSHEDAALKSRIRRLRIISRVLAFLISIAVLVPITMTLAKFLSTQNTYRTFTGAGGQPVTRTAWAKDTRAWPTWAYFAVAATSVVLNFCVVFSYKFGVKNANVASYVTSSFSWVVMVGNVVVWSVAAGMYRGEKDKGGKSDDLWGWTCSAAARAIQKEFARDVDFDRFCNVQSISWYIGLIQAGSAILTIIIYILAVRRKKSKKQLEQHLLSNQYGPAHH